MFLMAELGKQIVEERIVAAQGGREFRRFLTLEYGKHVPPPTAIPARWNTKGCRVRARVRRAFARVKEAALGG